MGQITMVKSKKYGDTQNKFLQYFMRNFDEIQ